MSLHRINLNRSMSLHCINLIYVWVQLFVHVESASGCDSFLLSLSFLTMSLVRVQQVVSLLCLSYSYSAEFIEAPAGQDLLCRKCCTMADNEEPTSGEHNLALMVTGGCGGTLMGGHCD